MSIENLNLKIYEISDFEENSRQKCLIPIEFYPRINSGFGPLAKCYCDANLFYFCQLYPMKNEYPRNFCYLDKSVAGGAELQNKTFENQLLILKKIDILPFVAGAEILSISTEVLVNENIFKSKLNKDYLPIVIRAALQNYYLIDNITIKTDEFYSSLGIAEINVFGNSESSAYFRINRETEISILNVKLLDKISLKQIPLEALDSFKNELNKLIQDFKFQREICNWKLKPSFNLLLNGPTGCGKTALLHNFLLENHCNVFPIRSSDIIKQYPGETESELRKIFENANTFNKIFKPKDLTIILIEDIELICPIQQDQNSTDVSHQLRISSQLLSILDKLHSNYENNIIVFATTSKIDQIHNGLRRPGRFEKEIAIPILNEAERKNVFNLMLNGSPLKKYSNLEKLLNIVSRKTPGYVGADLLLLMQNVVQTILRQKKDFEFFDVNEILEIFEQTIKKMKPASIKGTDIQIYKSEENFEKIGGMIDLKKILRTSILAGLRNKEAFKRFGLQMPKGILLYGPPGCAKTTIAKCLANEANMTFIATSGAEVYSPYVGNAEKFIVKIFDTARRSSPCLIFLDEIDTLVGKRSISGKSDVQSRILSTLLTEMDGIGFRLNPNSTNENNILVVAATNRPDMIDDALMRPGRFDKLIHVPAPDLESRLEILKIYKLRMPFSKDIDLLHLAEQTVKFSGADLCNLCNEAAMSAFTKDFNVETISKDDFECVLEKTKPSLTDKQINWYYEFENKYRC